METGESSRKQSVIGWAILLFWYSLYVFLDFWMPMIQYLFPGGDPNLKLFWITEKWCFNVENFGNNLVLHPFNFILIPIYFVVFYVAPTALSIWWTVRLSRKWKSTGSE